MKLLVCVKQVPHSDAHLKIDDAGTWIDEQNVKFEINPYDRHAVEAALRMKDDHGAEIVVVSIGPDRVTQSLRVALGMGADRAIHVCDPIADGSDSLGTARILAAIARLESPDLLFAGFMSQDCNAAACGPMLATLLGIPHVTAATAIEVSGESMVVHRELEGGVTEAVDVSRPCVITIQTGINEVRYASIKGIMAAQKKPIDVKSIDELRLTGKVGLSANNLVVESIEPRPKGTGAEILEGSTGEIVDQVVQRLRMLGHL